MVPASAINRPALSTEPSGSCDGRTQAASVRTLTHQNLLSGAKSDASFRRLNAPVVLHVLADEKNRSAGATDDLAVVDDIGRRRRPVEFPRAAVHEIGRHRRGGGHDQARDADRRLAADIKSRLILEHDEAIGVEVAENLRGVGIVDPVPDDGRGGGLGKSCGFADADVEAAPINERAVGSMHVQLRTLRRERRGALAHRRVLWIRQRDHGCQQKRADPQVRGHFLRPDGPLPKCRKPVFRAPISNRRKSISWAVTRSLNQWMFIASDIGGGKAANSYNCVTTRCGLCGGGHRSELCAEEEGQARVAGMDLRGAQQRPCEHEVPFECAADQGGDSQSGPPQIGLGRARTGIDQETLPVIHEQGARQIAWAIFRPPCPRGTPGFSDHIEPASLRRQEFLLRGNPECCSRLRGRIARC